MKGLLNWEAIHRKRGMPFANLNQEAQKIRWGGFARMYDGMSKLETKYTAKQVDQLILSPEDTVADIGCGTGRLAVPVSKRVKSVTAVDFAPEMLGKCMDNAREANADNVVPLELNWMEEGAENVVGMHDIAIASRSVGFSDIVKLNRIARKYVFVLSFVSSAPSLREIQLDFMEGFTNEKVAPDPDARMFGYNVTFNMLYDMGIDPNIVMVEDGFERDFASREEAYEHLRFVGEIGEENEARYRSNVDKYLQELPQGGGYRLLRKTKSYVLWWEPKQMSLNL